MLYYHINKGFGFSIYFTVVSFFSGIVSIAYLFLFETGKNQTDDTPQFLSLDRVRAMIFDLNSAILKLIVSFGFISLIVNQSYLEKNDIFFGTSYVLINILSLIAVGLIELVFKANFKTGATIIAFIQIAGYASFSTSWFNYIIYSTCCLSSYYYVIQLHHLCQISSNMNESLVIAFLYIVIYLYFLLCLFIIYMVQKMVVCFCILVYLNFVIVLFFQGDSKNVQN